MLFPFLLALLSSMVCTRVMIFVARELHVVDRPSLEPKKHHTRAVPLLGGTAIFLSMALVLALTLLTNDALTFGLMDDRHFVGFLLGGLVLVIGGALDDRYTLKPYVTIWFPVAAAAIAVSFGIGVSKLTNPFGDPVLINTFASSIVTFVWLLLVMYTTKLLDGLDGLSTSISTIGVFFVMLLSLSARYFQPDAVLFASICLGALLGFLVWNAPPARIFLGEGGSTFVGYILGVLAVIAGSKLGIALLVLSIPFLDLLWVIGRRIFVERHLPTRGDRLHLHHRLLALGLSQRKVVFWYALVASTSGLLALSLQSRQKILLFFALVVGMIALGFILTRARSRYA